MKAFHVKHRTDKVHTFLRTSGSILFRLKLFLWTPFARQLDGITLHKRQIGAA